MDDILAIGKLQEKFWNVDFIGLAFSKILMNFVGDVQDANKLEESQRGIKWSQHPSNTLIFSMHGV